MSDINIAVIGHGFMGHEHENMLYDFPGIKLIGFSDIDLDQLKDVREGLKKYNNNEELLNDPDVDTVIIAANNNQHHDLVIKAANAKKNVICEKPVAMSLNELDEMEAACKNNGVTFTVHQQRRFDQDFRTAKEVYDTKTLGDVYAIKSCLYGFNGNMHDWHVYVSEGGGMLYDWGVHLLDQICWMFPNVKIKSVFADIRNVINQEVDDYFQIMLRLENGITVTVELGTYYLSDKVENKWFEHHWFLAGNKGCAYMDGFSPSGKIVRTTHLLTNVKNKRTMTEAGPTRSFGPAPDGTIVTEDIPVVQTEHKEFFEHYLNYRNGKEDAFVKISEVRRVLRLMDAVRESGRTGKSIDFEV